MSKRKRCKCERIYKERIFFVCNGTVMAFAVLQSQLLLSDPKEAAGYLMSACQQLVLDATLCDRCKRDIFVSLQDGMQEHCPVMYELLTDIVAEQEAEQPEEN